MSIMSVVAGFLVVFFFRLLSVTLGTARQIIVIRGYKYPGAALGFFEVLIFTLAISKVVKDGAIGDILGYSLGFSVGIIVGSLIEEKLALGYYNVRIITHEKAIELVETLREHGFGVTEVIGEGRDGLVYILEVVARRRDIHQLQKCVRQIHDGAFIVVDDAQSVQRGYFISESTR
jgi:uncharacterized protein YebE (UPF0316 family)